MSLYRIMLVDDEEEVRKAMIRKMDWEQLGFTVAGDAETARMPWKNWRCWSRMWL